MLAPAFPDLDSLDFEAMKALVIAQHERYSRTLTSRATEIDRLTLLVKEAAADALRPQEREGAPPDRTARAAD